MFAPWMRPPLVPPGGIRSFGWVVPRAPTQPAADQGTGLVTGASHAWPPHAGGFDPGHVPSAVSGVSQCGVPSVYGPLLKPDASQNPFAIGVGSQTPVLPLGQAR